MEIGLKQIGMGIVICIGVLGLLLSIVKSKYMVSKKVAAKNLEAFLGTHYGSVLDYSDLNRFFNSGNMNPNCFRALVFEKENPRVSLIITFDAKEIIEQTDIPSNYPDGLSFHERYQERVLGVKIQNEISEKMKPLGVHLEWDYNSVAFNLGKNYTEAAIFEKENYFLHLFNQEDSNILGHYHNLALVLRMPSHTDAYLERSLEQEGGIWSLKGLKLYKHAKGFGALKKTMEAEKHKYLEANQPKQKLYDYYGSFIDPTNFDKLLFIVATETKKTQKEEEARKKGVWVSPLTGYVVTYWDVVKQQALFVDFVAMPNPLTMEEIIEKEKEAFLSASW